MIKSINKISAPIDTSQEEIAIIAMEGSFTGCENLDTYWKRILNGENCLEKFEKSELSSFGVPPHVLNNDKFVNNVLLHPIKDK